MFSKVVVPVCLPISTSASYISLPVFGMVSLFRFSHSNRYVMISHSGFNLLFS